MDELQIDSLESIMTNHRVVWLDLLAMIAYGYQLNHQIELPRVFYDNGIYYVRDNHRTMAQFLLNGLARVRQTGRGDFDFAGLIFFRNLKVVTAAMPPGELEPGYYVPLAEVPLAFRQRITGRIREMGFQTISY